MLIYPTQNGIGSSLATKSESAFLTLSIHPFFSSLFFIHFHYYLIILDFERLRLFSLQIECIFFYVLDCWSYDSKCICMNKAHHNETVSLVAIIFEQPISLSLCFYLEFFSTCHVISLQFPPIWHCFVKLSALMAFPCQLCLLRLVLFWFVHNFKSSVKRSRFTLTWGLAP